MFALRACVVQRCAAVRGLEGATVTATDAAGNLASPDSHIHPFARITLATATFSAGRNTRRYGTIGSSSGLATGYVAA
ncbi:MAG: hypothetical protein WCB10_17305, partial [Steroidobacteraceae bacterium]